MKEKFYPSEENLGNDCRFWQNGCTYPKAEVQGRLSCEGVIDDVCLYLLGKSVKRPNLSPREIIELKHTAPSHKRNRNIPAER